MDASPESSPVRVAGPPRLALELRDADGAPWVLILSPGMERFIGAYPRLDGFDTGGALVTFRAA